MTTDNSNPARLIQATENWLDNFQSHDATVELLMTFANYIGPVQHFERLFIVVDALATRYGEHQSLYLDDCLDRPLAGLIDLRERVFRELGHAEAALEKGEHPKLVRHLQETADRIAETHQKFKKMREPDDKNAEAELRKKMAATQAEISSHAKNEMEQDEAAYEENSAAAIDGMARDREAQRIASL